MIYEQLRRGVYVDKLPKYLFCSYFNSKLSNIFLIISIIFELITRLPFKVLCTILRAHFKAV